MKKEIPPQNSRAFHCGFRLKGLVFAMLLGFAVPAWALDGTWLSSSGTGAWNDSVKWVGGNIAGGGSSIATLDGATGRAITLTAPVTVGNISVTNWTSASWNISSGTLTLDAGVDKPKISNSGGGSDSLGISSVISGTNGFEKLGDGRLYLSGANTFTGDVKVSQGILWTSGSPALNSAVSVTLSGGAAGGRLLLGSTSGATYNNNIMLNGNNHVISAANLAVTLGGVISESGGVQSIRFFPNGNDTGFTLLGDNSYTGNTLIGTTNDTGSLVLRVGHGNALGTGTANVAFNSGSKTRDDDALEIVGGITVANKALTLRGKGRNDAGSLRSVSGSNTWSGTVNIGGGTDASIGVDADTLTIGGLVIGTATNGLRKVGAGTLALTADNTYTGGTSVDAGTLLAGHAGAIGDGNLTLGDGSGTDTLRIAAGIALVASDLTLASSAKLVFDLTGSVDATKIAVSGNQIGTGIYTVNVFDGGGLTNGTYTLLTVAGTFQATDFVLGTTPIGYDSSYLQWSGGTLSLNVIPEPGSLALIGMAFGLVLLSRRKW